MKILVKKKKSVWRSCSELPKLPPLRLPRPSVLPSELWWKITMERRQLWQRFLIHVHAEKWNFHATCRSSLRIAKRIRNCVAALFKEPIYTYIGGRVYWNVSGLREINRWEGCGKIVETICGSLPRYAAILQFNGNEKFCSL